MQQQQPRAPLRGPPVSPVSAECQWSAPGLPRLAGDRAPGPLHPPSCRQAEPRTAGNPSSASELQLRDHSGLRQGQWHGSAWNPKRSLSGRQWPRLLPVRRPGSLGPGSRGAWHSRHATPHTPPLLGSSPSLGSRVLGGRVFTEAQVGSVRGQRRAIEARSGTAGSEPGRHGDLGRRLPRGRRCPCVRDSLKFLLL